MSNARRQSAWNPYLAGALIGMLNWVAFATAGHAIEGTGAFESNAALAISQLRPSAGRASSVPAALIDWEWMLVLGIIAGGWLSARLMRQATPATVSETWCWHYGPSVAKRLMVAFSGGALMVFGARMAQGCTSGHGLGGTLQLSLSSWTFALVMFSASVGAAWVLYGGEGRRDV